MRYFRALMRVFLLRTHRGMEEWLNTITALRRETKDLAEEMRELRKFVGHCVRDG